MTATATATDPERGFDGRNRSHKGLVPHLLIPSRQREPIAVALLEFGSAPPEPPDGKLLRVIADAMASRQAQDAIVSA